MAINSSKVKVGTSGATPIQVDVSGASTSVGDQPWANRFVTLSANHTLALPLSFPTLPLYTGAAPTTTLTLTNGTRFQTFACHADALVTGGFAAYS
jgi:hypothetical protein